RHMPLRDGAQRHSVGWPFRALQAQSWFSMVVPSRHPGPRGGTLGAPNKQSRKGHRMLTNKRAVVTGSTSGIGLAIARELASNGAHVVINGFGDADAIEKERVNLELEFGVKAHYINADLSKGQDTRDFIDAAASALGGGVDILVNNAGIQHTSRIESFPVDRWDAIIALNLSAVFHGTAAALPYMQKQGWGRII